jgi:hypothetical protein
MEKTNEEQKKKFVLNNGLGCGEKYQIHFNVRKATIHELIETDLFTG